MTHILYVRNVEVCGHDPEMTSKGCLARQAIVEMMVGMAEECKGDSE